MQFFTVAFVAALFIGNGIAAPTDARKSRFRNIILPVQRLTRSKGVHGLNVRSSSDCTCFLSCNQDCENGFIGSGEAACLLQCGPSCGMSVDDTCYECANGGSYPGGSSAGACSNYGGPA